MVNFFLQQTLNIMTTVVFVIKLVIYSVVKLVLLFSICTVWTPRWNKYQVRIGSVLFVQRNGAKESLIVSVSLKNLDSYVDR